MQRSLVLRASVPSPSRNARIRSYWAAHPCGRNVVGLPEGDPAFFDEHDRILGVWCPYIRGYLSWLAAVEGFVLEVGCGMGFHTASMVRLGRTTVAVDLTWESARLAALRLKRQGLKGYVVVADGAALPFRDGAFGGSMAMGVIQHTDLPERVVGEMHRVTRSGGRALFMIYNRFSRHTLWILGFLWPVMGFLHVAPGFLRRWAFRIRPGLQDYWLQNRLPGFQDVVNAGTDAYGLKNPLSRLYSLSQARRVLSPFRVRHFSREDSHEPGRATRFHRWLYSRVGFFLYAQCTK